MDIIPDIHRDSLLELKSLRVVNHAKMNNFRIRKQIRNPFIQTKIHGVSHKNSDYAHNFKNNADSLTKFSIDLSCFEWNVIISKEVEKMISVDMTCGDTDYCAFFALFVIL